MIQRTLASYAFQQPFRQMRFITGPRQTGKTTLVKWFLKETKTESLYFNWDTRDVRDQYRKDPYFFETTLYDLKQARQKPWVCFDELHKMPKWKNILKDYFDKYENDCRFAVTGSARLDWLKKSGDSLAGRYFTFNLFPFSLAEAAGTGIAPHWTPKAVNFIEQKIQTPKYEQAGLDQLLRYSGFPEPFLKGSDPFYRIWSRDLIDRIVREDVRDITRIVEIENLVHLMSLLPERIGAPISLNAIKEDLSVSYNAIKNYLSVLEKSYVLFLIPPYAQRITRSLKKEKKCYFYDWSRCSDSSKKFENYVALELKILVSSWNEQGLGNFGLFFVRTKDGYETDFLITSENKPWCLFEVKLQDEPIAYHHKKHAALLGHIPLVQITHQSNLLKKEEPALFRVSASRFFASSPGKFDSKV